MKSTKPLPNYIYISTSLIICILLSIKALYLKEVAVVPVICYAALTLISTIAAIFIKDYKTEESAVIEILQAIVIPGFLFTLYSMLIDKRVIYISIIIIVGGTIAYTAALIKVNIIDSGRSFRSRYTKKVIAIGLYNARAFFLALLGVFVIAGSLIIASDSLYEKRLEKQYEREKTINYRWTVPVVAPPDPPQLCNTVHGTQSFKRKDEKC